MNEREDEKDGRGGAEEDMWQASNLPLTGLTIMVANFPRLGPRQDEAAVAPEMSVSMFYWFVEEELMDVHASNRTGRQGARYLLFLLPSRSPVRVVLVGGVVARSELGVVWGTGRRCHVKHDTCIESCEGGTCSAKRDCELVLVPASRKGEAFGTRPCWLGRHKATANTLCGHL